MKKNFYDDDDTTRRFSRTTRTASLSLSLSSSSESRPSFRRKLNNFSWKLARNVKENVFRVSTLNPKHKTEHSALGKKNTIGLQREREREF